MDFPLPPVGEGLYEVELVRWLVRPGDAVSRGQGLAEVLSDKATMEVPAPFAGTVTGLSATPGSKGQWWRFVLILVVTAIVLVPIAAVFILATQPSLGSSAQGFTLENFVNVVAGGVRTE